MRISGIVMQALNQIFAYGEFLNVLASIFGIVGFVFGAWRYLKERKAQKQLDDRQHQLEDALIRLEHLKELASGLNQYSKAV
jgi:hypothetical protein